jgi:2-oxo-3-hexenedioate decarboxylase
MTDTSVLAAIAREIREAQQQVRQIPPFSTRVANFDLSAAYRVAQINHAACLAAGGVPVGRKIGFTNAAMWERYQVCEPLWSYLYAATVVFLEGDQGHCSIGRLCEPKIEPEIVLHFDRTPPAGASAAEILACVDWVAHGFEIVQSHYPNWQFAAADVIADSVLHGTLLLGTPQPVSCLGEDPLSVLQEFSVTLSCNGTALEVGQGSNVLGSPVAAVAHLNRVLAVPGSSPLAQDEMVTTGTITTAHAIRVGETWNTTLSGIDLPGLSVTLVE